MKPNRNSKSNRIVDYISGLEAPGTPEEIEATQPMAKILVDELNYPKSVIRTRPQFQIPKSPSDTSSTYPLDIVVFESDCHDKDNIRMIVECKSSDIKTGRTQLEKYMGLCSAKLGVWFNGNDIVILKKIVSGNKFAFQELPFIPKHGVDLDADICLYKSDLKSDRDLKPALNRIRNFLAAREEGITQDSTFAEEIINIILCKIYNEKEADINEPLLFSVSINEAPEDAKKRIDALFENVKGTYPDIFDKSDKLNLSAQSIFYCVGQLQEYSLLNASRDVVGDAFEVFIGPTLRGSKGQYFTPRNVTNFCIEALNPSLNKTILDPSCGSGGFLISGLDFIWKKLAEQKHSKGWDDAIFTQKKIEVASKSFFGLDKDRFLTKVAKAYMAIMGDGKGGIFCEDTLKANENYSEKTKERLNGFKFDYVLANPPYGKEIKIQEKDILSLYELGHVFKNGKKTSKLTKATRPQILFIEKILNFLKDNGSAAIVLPETLFSNKNDRYIMEYLLSRVTILGVISLPSETFKPSTDVKTCIVILKNEAPKNDYNIFMAICRNIGHDMRAKLTNKDDLPQIIKNYSTYQEKYSIKVQSELGFTVRYSELTDSILTPHTYWYKKSHDFTYHNEITLRKLIDEGVISTYSGKATVEASQYVSTGIPFVRTSDIQNLEIARSTSKYISKSDYENLKNISLVQHKDILFVRRGRTSTEKSNGLIGEVAFVMKHQTEIVLQGAITGIRVNINNKYGITPENFIYLISENNVKKQIKSLCGTEGALTGLTDETFPQIKIDAHNTSSLNFIHSKMSEIIHNKERIEELMVSLAGINSNNGKNSDLGSMICGQNTAIQLPGFIDSRIMGHPHIDGIIV